MGTSTILKPELKIVTIDTNYRSDTQYTVDIETILPDKYSELSINNFALRDINVNRLRNSSSSTAANTVLYSYNNSTGDLLLKQQYTQIKTADSDLCRFWVAYNVVIFYVD